MFLPRDNPNLFGHEATEATFLAEFARGNLHHAYLLTGAKGIGKATLAYRLARFFLAQGAISKPKEEESFSLFGESAPVSKTPQVTSLAMENDHPIFRRVAAGSHTDLLAVTPVYDSKKQTEKTEISADQAREVPQFLSLTPAESSWRVVIVDAVDQLNNAAANALLKILEEPPPRSILLLVCHMPGRLLATVRSRCRLLRLKPPAIADFSRILAATAPEIPNAEHAALYGLAQGSPGQAISLHEKQALTLYRAILAAMQPGTRRAERVAIAQKLATTKSPEQQNVFYYCWQMAIDRVQMAPHFAHLTLMDATEASQLTAIANALGHRECRVWRERAQQLWRETTIYNLDKSRSFELLLDPARLPLATSAA
ncbi:MAG: DNA polymerase III subunit delta' [Rickettsiales bacterium]|nr:DNA polymerase III subunit delta' [Rickettsiales bacterium]